MANLRRGGNQYTHAHAWISHRKARKDHAEAILIEVSIQHDVDLKSLRQIANFPHMNAARRDYARRCLAAGISCTIAGEVIGRDHTTILNAARVLSRCKSYKRETCRAS